MKTGRPSGQTRLEKTQSPAQPGKPSVDKGGLPSLSDYTPPTGAEVEMKYWIGVAVVIIAAVIILPILMSAVVSGMAAAAEHPRAVTASAGQPDTGTIIVTYTGGPDAGSLLEMEGTVSPAAGPVQVKTLGSRTGTAPPVIGTVLEYTGSFSGNDRVVLTAYFADGKEIIVLDTFV